MRKIRIVRHEPQKKYRSTVTDWASIVATRYKTPRYFKVIERSRQCLVPRKSSALPKTNVGKNVKVEREEIKMKPFRQRIRSLVLAAAATLIIALGWTIGMAASAQGLKVSLSGDQQVPPVSTSASGNGTITVSPDKSVSGSITISGMDATAAHIHEGAAGKTGPVIIPLSKGSDDTWSVPAGAKLTDAQYKSYLAGDLYVNVHSAAHKGGEIRAQLSPK